MRIIAHLVFLLTLTLGAALQSQNLQVVQRHEYGLLARTQGKQVLFMAGSPEQMGAAHGALLSRQVQQVSPRTMSLVAAAYCFGKGEWFYDKIEEILRRSQPHTPQRFIDECLSMGKAAGIGERDALCLNFFPELFHCSGVALRGKASLNGEIIHARVLDYMADINLQKYAALQVYMPEDYNNWVSVGYAGFMGTVTAMNDKGLAIGEMGGKGEGDWDGMPMSFLMRDIMERAGTVREALQIFRETPRSCEYYYVISDKSGDMAGVYATPEIFEVLEAGQQDERLPKVPEDTVMFSAGERAKKLSERLHQHYGKITAELMIEIIKRPVAMKSNLHNAVFKPASLDLWFADAGIGKPACDMPYAKVNLNRLIEFYQENK